MSIDQTGTVLQIQNHYAKRQENGAEIKYSAHPVYQNYIIKEREAFYLKCLANFPKSSSELKFLEVGAGLGLNIPFFEKCGIQTSNIYVNELLDDRIEALYETLKTRNIFPGDALDLPFENEFDVVFQSTVFTSILSEPFRIALAKKMWQMLNDDGVVLWYDFVYNNPNNPDVRKASRGDVLKYFPQAKHIEFHSVTLAPPVGRRIGHAYQWMNALFPFLRSHLIAIIYK
jgi:phospholipid N-methyltransferase